MEEKISSDGITVLRLAVGEVGKRLIDQAFAEGGRGALFQLLANELKKHFAFDRLCINLYDPEYDVISLFSEAGTVVKGFPSVRHLRGSISELVISSRKPVIVQNIQEQMGLVPTYPMVEAGLNATVAAPLIVGREILGTIHCSFSRAPDNMVEILNFLVELSPVLSLCLYLLLKREGPAAGRPEASAKAGTGYAQEFFDTPDMQKVLPLIRRVSRFNVPVLICGETGTGKSTLARYIHDLSARARARFVKVNCPSLAPTLFESELFGHARGAFTGAHEKRVGRLEMARGGTLFLDEISELAPEIQSKLLHVLEESSFERVGENIAVPMDVRLIAATNVNIGEALAGRRLRRDIFYRLAAAVVTMPPLRRRPNDIPLLAGALMQRQARIFGLPPIRLAEDALSVLKGYPWPGNIRELRNVINRLLIYTTQSPATAPQVRRLLEESEAPGLPPDGGGAGSRNERVAPLCIREVNRQRIEEALAAAKGVLGGPRGAASLLGLPRSTLQYRMRKLGIRRP